MAIGASNQFDERKSFDSSDGEWWWSSNYGTDLDLLAPGVSIWTCELGGGHIVDFNGTSAACPFVAGAAALIRALVPSLSWMEVRDLLRAGAEDQVGLPDKDTPGFDIYYGYGRLNAHLAIPAPELPHTERINVGLLGQEADSPSNDVDAAITPGGRFVAFANRASNLGPVDSNGVEDMFVRDRKNCQTVVVSISSSGELGDRESFAPSVSADGRRVAFLSRARNLVAGAPPTVRENVYVHDRDSDGDGFFDEPGSVTTELASPTLSSQFPDEPCYGARISGDGRFVAFHSSDDGFVAGDSHHSLDVFVRDVLLDVTVRVSVDSNGVADDHGSSVEPANSQDGRFVAFAGDGDLAGEASSSRQILLHDRDADADGEYDEPGAIQTTLVSRNSGGEPANDDCSAPMVSSNLRFLAFVSQADNLDAIDTSANEDIYVRDLVAGTTRLASLGAWGTPSEGSSAHDSGPVVSDDGNVVVFESSSDNLVVADTISTDTFLREMRPLLATAFCLCTGQPWSGPCGNDSREPAGCLNSTGEGAVLFASGSSSVAADDLSLTVTQLPPHVPVRLLWRRGAGAATVFGDGLECLGLALNGRPLFPHGMLDGDSGPNGEVTFGPGMVELLCASMGGSGCIDPGDTWNFQCWYRDLHGPCGMGTNISNAVGVTFVP